MPRPQSDADAFSHIWLTVRWTPEHCQRSHLVKTWQTFHLDHLPGDPEARARLLVAALDGAIRSATLRRQSAGAPREQLFCWQAGQGYLPTAPVTPPSLPTTSCQP